MSWYEFIFQNYRGRISPTLIDNLKIHTKLVFLILIIKSAFSKRRKSLLIKSRKFVVKYYARMQVLFSAYNEKIILFLAKRCKKFYLKIYKE